MKAKVSEIMGTYDLICLYLASILSFEKIIELKDKYQKIYNKKKLNAHALEGKTTSRRKGRKDADKAQIREINKKIDNVLFFKKQIRSFPEILEFIKNLYLEKKFLFLWLFNEMNTKSIEKRMSVC
jgi:hypothetical protein